MTRILNAWTSTVLAVAVWLARAEAQPAAPSPLASAATAVAAMPGGWLMREAQAAEALQTGFAATAAAGFREVLRESTLPVAARQRVTLALVSAQMDQGDLRAAEETLGRYDGPRTMAYLLRSGLLAANRRRTAQAKAAVEAGGARMDELSPAERGWWYYLQALVAELENDTTRRNNLFEAAQRAAVSQMQRARFVLGLEQARLMEGQANEQRLATLRANLNNERIQGTSLAYDFVRTYAAELVSLGRAAEAQAEVVRQLEVLPAARRDSDTADQLRLLLGLIAGEGSAARRQAFRQLLQRREGRKPETQQIALYLLARDAKTPADREALRTDVTELIGATTVHPIIEDLRVVRAQTALADRVFDQAEEDARELLDRYPGSRLKAAAWGVRVAVAWELNRFRAAAEAIKQLRTVLPAGEERAKLGVLLAEAYFRAGRPEDYRNAADAYDAALREGPMVVEPGRLLFQRVLSEIRADRLDRAQQLLDETAASPAFDPENRWQAEWNLVRELQLRNQTDAALTRVERLLGGGTTMPPELRTRMLWLQAKLSFELGRRQPESGRLQATRERVDELLRELQAGGPAMVPPELKNEVVSTALLLKSQAQFSLGQDEDGRRLLDALRADHRETKAAQESYIVQAARASQKGDVVEAQQLLKRLVDEHPASVYAPLALYEAALIAERLGLDRNLEDAYNLLERLCTHYPKDEFVFYARLKQGDLMMKLNDPGSARRFYDDLTINYAQHPEVVRAEMALAMCLYGQSANAGASTNFEQAVARFERLRDKADAPVDARVEAGFRWGYALAKRGQTEKAVPVLWSVVSTFLLDVATGEKLGATGRWWISRTLLELGQMHEDLNQLDDAKRAYDLLIERRLGGAAVAEARRARFSGPKEGR
jgi:TolA-binding protein